MRIFVVEFITGGGLIGEQMSAGLLKEAEIMLAALLNDLTVLPDVHVTVSLDPRLPPLGYDCDVITPKLTDNVWEVWEHCINCCDAVWAIMPESGGLLHRIALMTLARNRRLIGSQPGAVTVAASKLLTAKTLQREGIDTVQTFDVAGEIPFSRGRWVLKPDDGVGGEGSCVFESFHAMHHALQDRDRYAGYVAQPFLSGTPASLSMLCSDRTTTLLTANLQQVQEVDGRFELEGVNVNGMPAGRVRYARLARQIGRAIPGLWGYVGVDMVQTASGPVVLEVNPRLTLSYAGLHSVLTINPAQHILRMLQDSGGLSARIPAIRGSARVALDVPCVA